jgi:hypothetical protein
MRELRRRETAVMPSPCYLDFQPDYCDAHLRRQVAQWLDVSCAAHGFDDSVLTQAMSLFDRFLSVYQIDSGLGHWVPFLVGVAALSLAAKMEEVKVPFLRELQFAGGRGEVLFEGRDVMQMELLLLDRLGWSAACLTPHSFLLGMLDGVGFGLWAEELTKEVYIRASQTVRRMAAGPMAVHGRPSEIAAAACLFAMRTSRAFAAADPDREWYRRAERNLLAFCGDRAAGVKRPAGDEARGGFHRRAAAAAPATGVAGTPRVMLHLDRMLDGAEAVLGADSMVAEVSPLLERPAGPKPDSPMSPLDIDFGESADFDFWGDAKFCDGGGAEATAEAEFDFCADMAVGEAPASPASKGPWQSGMTESVGPQGDLMAPRPRQGAGAWVPVPVPCGAPAHRG